MKEYSMFKVTKNNTSTGMRLYIPEGALLPTETCPVAVKAIIAGRFILPKRTELVSAFYAISGSKCFERKSRLSYSIDYC